MGGRGCAGGRQLGLQLCRWMAACVVIVPVDGSSQGGDGRPSWWCWSPSVLVIVDVVVVVGGFPIPRLVSKPAKAL